MKLVTLTDAKLGKKIKVNPQLCHLVVPNNLGAGGTEVMVAPGITVVVSESSEEVEGLFDKYDQINHQIRETFPC